MNKTAFLILWAIIFIVVLGGIYFLFLQPEPGLPPAENNQNNQNNQVITSNNYQIQGMDIQILKEGTGEGAKAGDTVTVDYVGTLQDGTKFDSSIDRNEPLPFTLGENRVIQGWELGVLGMKVGEKRKLTIPPELGYGSAGSAGVIPPNAALIFEIDMLDIKAQGK